MTAPAQEAVARGAALLDRACPRWHERIDTASLDLASVRLCVLGQLYGGFGKGVAGLGLHGRLTEHGFRAGPSAWWDELLAAWTAEVDARASHASQERRRGSGV